MLSTITTATAHTIVTGELADSLSLIAVIIFLALLVQKEAATVASGPRARALSRALTVALVPLLMGFVLIVVARVAEVLSALG